MTDADFMAGRYVLQSDSVAAAIVNEGALRAANGGYIVLAGRQVTNKGTIDAPQGTAALAAGSQLVLDLPDNSTVDLAVKQEAINAAVTNNGKISANGGQAILLGRAGDTVLANVINNSGIIEAKSISRQNGVIRLDGGPNGVVTNSGTLDASGKTPGQTGGKITVVGDKVALTDGSTINASGDLGGGTVIVGGNFHGQGSEQNATAVYIGKNAGINADALTKGDGGKVAVWSEEATRFYGEISARGGSEAGNGGFVETSGKQYLDAQGTVDASAPKGTAGTWLMDPRNVTIQAGGARGTANEPDFVAVSDDAVVTTESIITALNGGTSVSINTGTGGLQSGNITVADDIVKTTGGDATLTLQAANNIIVESDITIASNNGKLNIDFNADFDGTYGGTIQLKNGSSLITNGGNIDLYGGTTGSSSGYAGSVMANTAGISLQGGVTLDTTATGDSGGDINLRGSNSGNSINDQTTGHFRGIALTGSGNTLKSGGGNISLTALGHGYYAGQEALAITDSNAQISAGTGAVSLTADSMTLSGRIGGQDDDSGTVTLAPLTQTTNIAIGDGAVAAAQTAEDTAAEAARTSGAPGIITALKLSSAVFSGDNKVIQSGLDITIGTGNTAGNNGSAGIIDINNVTFGNNVLIQAPGTSETPETQGEITISGPVSAAGFNITLNAYHGATTSVDAGIIAAGLQLIDPRQAAIYDFRLGNNQVDNLAVNTGRLLYTGRGDTTIGTVGTTNGITVSDIAASAVTLTDAGSDLTVTQAVVSHTSGVALALTATGDLLIADTSIAANNGSLSLTAGNLITTGASSITAGNGGLTLAADTMAFSDTTTIFGNGSLTLQTNSAGQAINIGNGAGAGLNLAGTLFHLAGGNPVFQDGFSSITLGQTAGTGTLTVDGAVTFHDTVTIQSTDGIVRLGAAGHLDNSATGEHITIKAGTFQAADGGILQAGSGNLLIEAGTLTLSGGSISGSGRLQIQPQHAGDAIALGSGATGLILPTAAFSGDTRIFEDGFAQIKIGRSDGYGAITVSADGITFTDKTLIQSPLDGGTLTINGPLSTGSDNLTLVIGNSGTQNATGAITASGLELLGLANGARGPQTVYDFSNAPNQIGTIAVADVNKVLISNGADLTVGTVNDTSGVEARRLYNEDNSTASADKVTLQVIAPGGRLTVAAVPVSSIGGGDITLTADQMAFSGAATVAGSGNLLIQPFSTSRAIDIGSFTPDTEHLQLSASLFDGAVFQDGFNSVTIGKGGNGGSSGKISIAGEVIFKDATTIQAPNTTAPGEIYLDKTANITVADVAYSYWNSLTLNAKSITADTSDAAQQANINAVGGQGYVYLKGDTISLGSGSEAGATVIGNSSRALYLRPFATTTIIDIGTDFAVDDSHLQFANSQFNNADYKIYSGFGSYIIGGNVTANLNVSGTAHFNGSLGLEGQTISVTDNGLVDPTGSIRLKAEALNFGKLAHVAGSWSLQLHPYYSSTGMVVGETGGYDSASNLLIPNGYFDGSDRTADGGGTAGIDGTARVFTGNYNNTVTFGSTDSAESVIMKNAMFPSYPSVPDNISIQAIGTGTVDITGTIAANKNISVWGGTITTQPGARLTSANGYIALYGNTLNLNSGARSISGTHDLYLRPYAYSGNVGLVGNDVIYSGGGLTLRQNMFYVTDVSAGALDNTFSKITIGFDDYGSYYGTGTITVNDIRLDNNLDLISYLADGTGSGKIIVAGGLNVNGRTIAMKASRGATQTGGVITADNLALLGGSGWNRQTNYDLTGANAVNTLAADAGEVVFYNAQELTIGTLSGALGGSGNITVNGITATYAENGGQVIMSTGNIRVSSDAGLTVAQQVKSVNGINNNIDGMDTTISLKAGGMLSTNGENAVITTTGGAPSGNIIFTADMMSFDPLSRVSGTGEVTIQPLHGTTGIGIGGGGGNTLELTNTLFYGANQVFQDGFAMINIGQVNGTGTVTVDNSVTFTDPVTIRSTGDGGQVVLDAGGAINNAVDGAPTNQPVTIAADTIITRNGSGINAGSGTTTLIAGNMDFSDGGSIDGTGVLVLRSPDTTTRIALGNDGEGGLQINSTDFNNVVADTLTNITVGQSDGANSIVINDFTAPDNLILLSPADGGTVTLLGTLNMSSHDLTITTAGKIDGVTGVLAAVNTLTATSLTDAIDLNNSTTTDGVTTFANSISSLGAIQANKSVAIGSDNSASLDSNADGLTITGQINSITGDVLIRTHGNLTLAGNSQVATSPTTGGDVYLSAEGTYAHFFNNSSRGAAALSPASGRWLVYSYSPIADNTIPDNQPYSAPGSTTATDVTGGLVKDYKYYGYTFNNHNPDAVFAPSSNLSGRRGMLYAYAPFLTPTSATRTYGYGNQTIVYTYSGFLPGDNELNTDTRYITQTEYLSTAAVEGTDAGHYTGDGGITTTQQIITDIGYIIDAGVSVPLDITKRTITVTADAQSKVYSGTSADDPYWSYTISNEGWYNDGSNTDYNNRNIIISGELARSGSSQNAGTYTNDIVQGSLQGNINYDINFIAGTYTIYKKPITVTNITADNKVYDGTVSAVLNSGSAALSGVIAADLADVTVDISGMTGSFTDKNAGLDKTVYVGGLGLDGSASGNYSLSNANTYTTTADITRRPVNVTADALGKTYGDVDPALTYTASAVSGNSNSGLVAGESLAGSLTRDSGENAAIYVINQGTVDEAHNTNYLINYSGANFTINKAQLTVTADNKTRLYGELNPELTATITGFKNGETLATSGVTGSAVLATAADNDTNVGTVSITLEQGTLEAGNYDFTVFNPGTLTVNKAHLLVTADNKTKTYGDANPELSATITGFKNGQDLATSGVAGIVGLSTAATELTGAGTATISATQGTLTAGNYDFTFQNGTLTINKAGLIITADDKSRLYGEANPILTGTGIGWKNSDGNSLISGLTTTATQTSNVGTYIIDASNVSAGNNYTIITKTDGTLTINKAHLTVIADNKTKVYGDDNPEFTFTLSGFKNGETIDTAAGLSGSPTFTTAAGKYTSVGSTAITIDDIGSLAADNYDFTTMTAGTLAINKRTLTVTADNTGKIYGSLDPAIFSYTAGGIAAGESYDGSLARDAGENVGSYNFRTGTLQITNADLGNVDTTANYNIIFSTPSFTISKRTLTITADAQSKTYGQFDPILTYQTNGLVDNDILGIHDTAAVVLSGGLSRTAGETVAGGPYAINQGSLTANNNYTISYTGSNLTINKADLHVTAQNASKTYGSADPTLTYITDVINNSIVQDSADSVLSGSLGRAAGETVVGGPYAIDQGSLTLAGETPNYNLHFDANDAKLTIDPKTLTIIADSKSKIYGNADPSLTYQVTGLVVNANLGINDTQASVLSGGLSRTAGETVVGGPYAIIQGSLAADNNYTISYTGSNLTIAARPITVTAINTSKIYGTADPVLNYSLADGSTLAAWDSNGGTLGRNAGENAGNYNFNSIPLTITKTADGSDSKSNYNITIAPSRFTINPATLVITADAQSKTYGQFDPILTYQTNGLVDNDILGIHDTAAVVLSGGLSRTAGETVAGGPYAISQGSLTANNNYTISYTGSNLTINKADLHVTAQSASKTYGSADPTLTYITDVINNSIVQDSASSVLSGSLGRAAGETVAGGPYAIDQGSLTLAGENPNYNLHFDANDAKLTIDPKTLTIIADSKSKIYGNADPSLTYQVTGLVVNANLGINDTQASVLSGGLSRAAGETVVDGPYAIGQGDLAANDNYTISYTGSNLTIAARPITVNAINTGKTYGTADPLLSYSLAGGSTLAAWDSNGGTLGRNAGENAGNYNFNAGLMTIIKVADGTDSKSNYTITISPSQFTIDKAALMITADDKSRIYGEANPVFSASYDGLVNGDSAGVVSGLNLATTANNTSSVGHYAITAGGASADNYTISYTAGDLTINQRPTTVTVDAGQHKIYGNSDPASFTYTATNLVNSDSFSGALSRDSGENAGSYAINQGTLDNPNYAITYQGANFTIGKAALMITADDKSRIYGEANPAFTASYNGLVNGDSADVVSGLLLATTADNTSSVGHYAITAGGASADNYTISYTAGDLTINQRPTTVTVDAGQHKIYGNSDPASFTYTATNLVNSDSFSGALSRDSGENAGSYAINQGTLDNPNYAITYQGANFTIDKAALTITADDKSRVYGDYNPAFTASYNGLVNGDSAGVVSGLLLATTANNTSSVGHYAITAGGASADNYTISYAAGELTVERRPVTVTVNAGQTKVYGHNNPSAYSYTAGSGSPGSGSGLVNGDSLTGALTRAGGENVGAYAIEQGSLTNANNANYTITYIGGDYSITPRTLTVTANDRSKTYGTADPELTYVVDGLADNAALGIHDTAASVLSGGLSREAGETVNGGPYVIGQGGLAANDNYTISYTGADFTINKATLTVTANDRSKTYGTADPELTYVVDGLVDNATLRIHDTAASVLSGGLSREAGETVNGGPYTIGQGDLAANDNYTISYTGASFTIGKAALMITADDKSRIYGEANPAFTASYNGLVNGDSADVVSGLLLATTADNTSSVGHYAITAGGASADNYTISYTAGDLTITPATLTYIADPVTRYIGAPNPLFTGTVTGFKNNEDIASATIGTLIFATSATGSSLPGNYEIIGSGLTAKNSNYVFVQDPANATALTVKGLAPKAQESVNNAKGSDPAGQVPIPPVNPAPGTSQPPAPNIEISSDIGLPTDGSGNVTINVNQNGITHNYGISTANDGTFTVNLGGQGVPGEGQLLTHTEGTSIPVFLKNGANIIPDGLYNVTLNQNKLTLIRTPQNVPAPPTISDSGTAGAAFSLTQAGGRVANFNIVAANGVLSIQPLNSVAAESLYQDNGKPAKAVLAAGILTAMQNLQVVPNQILGIFVIQR